jgi:hypothetical protein
MRAIIQLLTAIVVIGICGFSIARGFNIVHFSLAMANANSPETRAEIANTWGAAPDVASAALQADLNYQIDPSDQKAGDHRRQTLFALAAIEPLSSSNWLSLSGLQLVTDQPMEQVFDSLELSMLTGPNEGYLMRDRVIYGVSLWPRLSPDLKRHVAADLAFGEYNDPDSEKLQAFLTTQPEQVRNEVRDALVATGLSSNEIQERLGL